MEVWGPSLPTGSLEQRKEVLSALTGPWQGLGSWLKDRVRVSLALAQPSPALPWGGSRQQQPPAQPGRPDASEYRPSSLPGQLSRA